jgi:hypothetical protein
MCVSTAAHVTVQGPQYDQDITEIPHMGTLEMVVSPAVYDYDPTKPGGISQVSHS